MCGQRQCCIKITISKIFRPLLLPSCLCDLAQTPHILSCLAKKLHRARWIINKFMLFDPCSPNNKFGYFTAGEHFRSYSQFETQEYAAKTGDKIEWHFNDEFFSSIDWTIEPTETLTELYADRARQIRNKYDYIVLYFSGGSDSQNILSTFLENNIYLDEILTHHTYQGVGDKLSETGHLIEITLAAVPEAKKYIEKFPTTIHRIVDISEIIKDYWTDNLNDLKYNFMYYGNFYITPHNSVATNLPSILPEYKRLVDSGKQICFIHGNEKPNIMFDQKKWYFSFHSNAVESSFSIRRQIEKSPINDELFYWDPAAWKIIVKQSHVLRKYLYDNHDIIKTAIQGGFKTIPAKYRSRIHFFGNNIPFSVIKKAIYPYWRNDIVDIGKVDPTLFGIKNPWWSKSGLPGTKEHVNGIRYVMQTAGIGIEKPTQITYLSKRYLF